MNTYDDIIFQKAITNLFHLLQQHILYNYCDLYTCKRTVANPDPCFIGKAHLKWIFFTQNKNQN